MKNVVLRHNAPFVYAFLSFINADQDETETLDQKKILDCGAGGLVPPLVLFHQHGFQTWGIDASDEQLQRAEAFCEQHSIHMNLSAGDMRQMSFDDETFDYVYEHYSMCHLSKKDTARAIGEMYRVLKKGGLCFLGVISMDTWPKSVMGEEKEPGEFWGQEHGELTAHSLFTDQESDQLVSAWEIVGKEKMVTYLHGFAEKTSLEDWMSFYPEVQNDYSKEAWKAKYEKRADKFQYAHTYYFLRKSA
ncbi:MAG: class I SAM-dependent methyltransferase [Chloroflexi bacterium]|nr:class I SAM-dependent methyltransferase [Chloroflexota bacterium]